MIEGLKFKMTAQELSEYLALRISHHEERAKFYAESVAALKAGGATDPAPGTGGNYMDAMTRKQIEHGNKSKLFAFMRDHIVKDETYQLSEADLARLEIIDRYM